MDAYREETKTLQWMERLNPAPGMTAASGADAAAGAEEDEDEKDGGERYGRGRSGRSAKPARPPAKLERLQKILVASRSCEQADRGGDDRCRPGDGERAGGDAIGDQGRCGRDHIRVNGKLLKGAERHRYFMLNKPKGYVTTVSDPEKRPTVMEFFAKTSERLYPVGRLDYQSEGLLLMTNDGELANLLTKAGSGVEKVYLVKVAGQPSEEELERLRGGVTIEKGEVGSARVRTAPARIRLVRVGENPWYEVVLTEGRNRELRKMFAAIGHFAEKIRRVEYGPLVLDMEPGKMRELTEAEVNALRLTAEGKMKPRRTKLDISLPKESGRKKQGQGTKGPRDQANEDSRDRSGSRANAVQSGAESGRGSTSVRVGRREQVRDLARDRADRLERSRDLAEDATAVRREAVRGRGSIRVRVGRREQVQGLVRDRVDRLERSRDLERGLDLAADATAARAEAASGAVSGRGSTSGLVGRRELVQVLARDRADRLERSRDLERGQVLAADATAGKAGTKGPRDQGTEDSEDLEADRNSPVKPEGSETGRQGRFDGAARKPFRPQSERPFSKPGEGPAKRFDSGRDSGRRTGSKARWVPRPNSARSEEGRGPAAGGDRPAAGFEKKRWEVRPDTAAGAERARPAYGARPDAGRTRPAFGARPAGQHEAGRFQEAGLILKAGQAGRICKAGWIFKTGGSSRPSGSSRPGGFSKTGKPGGGGSRGGSRFGGKRPGGKPKILEFQNYISLQTRIRDEVLTRIQSARIGCGIGIDKSQRPLRRCVSGASGTPL